MQKHILFAGLLLAAMGLGSFGCASAGNQFTFAGPSTLQIGKTTKAQVLEQYGEPFRAGYDNGNLKWTYGYYKYRLIGDTETKDLVITFDKTGLVKGYDYQTSMKEERQQILNN